MAWLVVNHFLSLGVLRELSAVLIDRLTTRRFRLEDLFEEIRFGDTPWNESWLLRRRPTDDRHASDLQNVIDSLVWRNDYFAAFPRVPSTASFQDPSALISAIMPLCSMDLSAPDWVFEEVLTTSFPLQDSLRRFVDAIRLVRSTRDVSAVAELLAPIEMPLGPLLVKHVGDLLADADDWTSAAGAYDVAETLLKGPGFPPEWIGCRDYWLKVTAQSRATSGGIIEGPQSAASQLTELAGGALALDPAGVTNAAVDWLAARSHPDVDGIGAPDLRTRLGWAPLLIDSHDDTSALHLVMSRRYRDAHRHFWAVLRRQMALGSSTKANRTRARYAASILAYLQSDPNADKAPDEFRLFIRLIIDSLDASAAASLAWDERIVDTYVNHDIVEAAIGEAGRFAGCRRERELVVVALFQRWITQLRPDRTDAISRMWTHLARLAQEFQSEFHASIDIGRSALEALTELTSTRPEFRTAVSSHVAEAILTRLRHDTLLWGQAAALKAALAYADCLQPGTLTSIIDETLALLRRLDPENELWPLVRPAIAFAICTPVKAHLVGDAPRTSEIVSHLVRFGIQQESERARILPNLRDFDASLLRDSRITSQLDSVIAELREEAGNIRSTRATEAISALLLAPTLSRRDGIRDALGGLTEILRSIDQPRSSPGLPYAYECFLVLADNIDGVRAELGDVSEPVDVTLGRLVADVAQVWILAAERPSLLARFAFPPRKDPDPTIVHNWAFASFRLSEVLIDAAAISAGVAAAASNPSLAPSIKLARASTTLRRRSVMTPDAIREDDRESFYASLGMHLVHLESGSPEEGRDLCSALVEQCLRFGPREIDAAVFVAAWRLELGDRVREAGLGDYVRRLDRTRDLRKSLWPLVELFTSGNAEDAVGS